MTTRKAPINLELEDALLGALILDSSAMLDVSPLLGPPDFFSDSRQAIAEAVWSIYDRKACTDAQSVGVEINRLGLESRVGDVTELGRLVERAPHAANALFFAETLRELSRKRQLIAILNQSLTDCYEADVTTDTIIATADARTLDIGGESAANRTKPAAAFARAAIDRMYRRADGEVMGVTTGLPDLDAITDGLPPSTLTVLAARPGHGKTALALSMAQAAAMGVAVPTLFISLEMGGVELGERLIVSRSQVSGMKARRMHLTTSDRRSLESALQAIQESGRFWIDDTPSMSVSALAQNARRMKARSQIGLVIVDYIQLIEPGRGEERASRQEQVAKVSRRLKMLAKQLDIPVLALSQLNRESEKREDRRPRLSDLRESGAIEQDADIVLALYRPELVKKDDRPNEAELAILKNRNGATGMVPLVFRKEIMRFESAAARELSDEQRFDNDGY